MELNVNIFTTTLIAILIVSVFGQEGGYGRRRRPRPRPDSRGCRYGSVGVCGGIARSGCPYGSTCRNVWPTPTAGLCCRDKPEPPKNSCPYGTSGGSCDIFNRQCRPGYTCQIEPGTRHGTCCKDQEERCPFGQNGVCEPIALRICGPGTRCKFLGNFPDAGGKCCRDRPVTNKGTCPPSSGRISNCAFDPSVNCLSNRDCTGGQLCCTEGCGRVCKNPVYPIDPILY